MSPPPSPPSTWTLEAAAGSGKGRGRSVRQLSWLCFLRTHQPASALLGLPSRVLALVAAASRRISSSSTDRTSRMYRVIRGFLVLAVMLLALEVVTYFKGWHFTPPTHDEAVETLEFLYASWLRVRVNYLAPPVQTITNVCIVLFLVQSVDRLVLVLGCFWIKGKADIEGGELDDYPMVLLQIPMCNEREVYQQSIAAVCLQDWPKERMLVQILDDSDDVDVQLLIKAEVHKWQQKDFQPLPDFLKKTIPHFKGHDDLALVQARWCFVNSDENLLTRLQNINFSFHFEVEQQVNGMFVNFFGFNGTAGVWRIKALEDSGGWLERTTVEDMILLTCTPRRMNVYLPE